MATPRQFRFAVAVLALVTFGALAGGCGSSGGEPGISARSTNHPREAASLEAGSAQSGSTRRPRGEELEWLRDAIVRGEARDYAEGTRVGGPAFQTCLEVRLRDALDPSTLARLVGVYRRPSGQQYSAQALNLLAEPLAARCGHRTYVPEMVNASRALRHGVLTGAAVRKLGVTYGPYLGVRCFRPDRVGCDRVGIDIVFDRSATGVVAVVDGRRLHLHTPGMHSGVRFRDWVGTFGEAGLGTEGSPFWIEDTYGPGKWAGYPPVYVTIEFRVTYAGGRQARALFGRVFLSPGWG